MVTGDGNVGDRGGGLECRFSLRLDLEDSELFELCDDKERLVLRRSLMLTKACIKRRHGRKCYYYCESNRSLKRDVIDAAAMSRPQDLVVLQTEAEGATVAGWYGRPRLIKRRLVQ